MTTRRSQFYVDTPTDHDFPPSRHSMFVSQSELDKRPPHYVSSSPAGSSSTLPASSGSVDRLTGLGQAESKKKHHRFSLSNLRSRSTFSLKPLFSGRKSSISSETIQEAARRDSGSQTEDSQKGEVGVQTQNAPTVDVPVQTCFVAWDGGSHRYGGRLSTPRSAGSTPPVDASAKPALSFAKETPRPLLVTDFVRKYPEITVLPKPEPCKASDSNPSLYDELNNDCSSGPTPTSSICSISPFLSKDPFSSELNSAGPSSPSAESAAEILPKSERAVETSKLSISDSSSKAVSDRDTPTKAGSEPDTATEPDTVTESQHPYPSSFNLTPTSEKDDEAVHDRCPSRGSKSVQFVLLDPEVSEPGPAKEKPRDVDAEFEALLRDLDIITDDSDKISDIRHFPCDEGNRKQALSSPKLKSAFDVLRQDFLAPIPENNETADSIESFTNKNIASIENSHGFAGDNPDLDSRIEKAEDVRAPGGPIDLESHLTVHRSPEGDANSSGEITADSVETSQELTASKSDVNVTYPAEKGSAFVYETGIKGETKQPPEKSVNMPTLPSFFEAQPKCGSPDDPSSTRDDEKCRDNSGLPQQADRFSTVSLESEFDNRNRYSRSNSCNSTRSSTMSGYDPFFEGSLKFDSCENLDQLEEEIIRSLCTPVQELNDHSSEILNQNADEDLSATRGNFGSQANADRDASNMRRAILDRLLSGASAEEPVFSQKNNTRSAFGTPQKYTATITRMQSVVDDNVTFSENSCPAEKDDDNLSDYEMPNQDEACVVASYPTNQVLKEMDSPKKTSIFVFPQVKSFSENASEISSVEVQVQQHVPPLLEVRRSSWSVAPPDSRMTPTQTPASLRDVIGSGRAKEDDPETQGQCEYTSCLKPSQMQNSPFLAELGSRSLTPRPENGTVTKPTPPLNDIASMVSEHHGGVANSDRCDYASCLKPSEVQNSTFTAELSELRANGSPLKRASPLPFSCLKPSEVQNNMFIAEPSELRTNNTSPFPKSNGIQELAKLNDSQQEDTVVPEIPKKSELKITLKTPEEKVNNKLTSDTELNVGDVTTNPSMASPSPPPPPPPPPSGAVFKSPRNSIGTSSSLGVSIRDQHSKLVPCEPKAFTPPKSPMMMELQRKFESRQKSIERQDGTESLKPSQEEGSNRETSHFEMDLNSGANNDYKLSSENGTKSVWKNDSSLNYRNKLQNGNNVTHSDQREQWSSLSNSPENAYSAAYQNGNKSQASMHFSPSTIITDDPPPPGAVLLDKKVIVDGDKIHTDKYYAIPVKEVLKETTSTTKFIPAPPKYEGIGPTEEGIPTGLRHSVKKENMHNWYKTMYKSLHKADENLDDTQEYIIGYMSEPEFKKDIMIRKKSYTLDNRQKCENTKLNNTHVKQDYTPSAKYTMNVYNVHPRLIEDYEPGDSSVTDNSITAGSKRFLPAMNVPKPSYEFKNGYESDTTVMRKPQQPVGLDPEEQKAWYREIQQGGEIPQYGLGKALPERPKDPVVGPPPPPPLNYPKQPSYQQAIRPQTLPSEYANQNGNGVCQQMNGIYEAQMRQAIHSELQQRMSPSSVQLSPPNRSLSKSPSKSPDMRTPARALFDFNAETPKELSLRKGDMVLVLRQLDKNWYEGEQRGIVGIFPINYVEIVPPEHISSPKKSSVEGLGKALYDFKAQTPIELSIRKGDTISLVRRVDINWFEGRIANKKGIVPVSYIQVLQQPNESNVSSPTTKTFTSSRSRSGSKERMQKQSPTPYSMHSPNSHSATDGTSKFQGRLKKGNSLIEPVLYRAVYSYSPQNSDEMELLEGDTVYVVEMCDDGWFVGTSVRTGVFGIFPGNYVEKA